MEAVVFSILGGLFWALALVGKRVGVQPTADSVSASEKQLLRSAYVTVVFLIGECLSACIAIAWLANVSQLMLRLDEWLPKLPRLALLGFINGFGTLGSLHALNLAAEVQISALVSILMNGIYTAFAPLMLALVFHEPLNSGKIFGIVLVVLGTVFSDSDIFDFLRSALLAHLQPKKSDEVPKFQPQKVKAIGVAVLTGVAWDIGILGNKMGVSDVPSGLSDVWPLITFLTSVIGMMIPSLMLLSYSSLQGIECPRLDSSWRTLITILVGMVGGLGGQLVTTALALGGSNSAVLSTLTNGVYSVAGAVFIAVLFMEVPTMTQLVSYGVVTSGVIILSLS